MHDLKHNTAITYPFPAVIWMTPDDYADKASAIAKRIRNPGKFLEVLEGLIDDGFPHLAHIKTPFIEYLREHGDFNADRDAQDVKGSLLRKLTPIYQQLAPNKSYVDVTADIADIIHGDLYSIICATGRLTPLKGNGLEEALKRELLLIDQGRLLATAKMPPFNDFIEQETSARQEMLTSWTSVLSQLDPQLDGKWLHEISPLLTMRCFNSRVIVLSDSVAPEKHFLSANDISYRFPAEYKVGGMPMRYGLALSAVKDSDGMQWAFNNSLLLLAPKILHLAKEHGAADLLEKGGIADLAEIFAHDEVHQSVMHHRNLSYKYNEGTPLAVQEFEKKWDIPPPGALLDTDLEHYSQVSRMEGLEQKFRDDPAYKTRLIRQATDYVERIHRFVDELPQSEKESVAEYMLFLATSFVIRGINPNDPDLAPYKEAIASFNLPPASVDFSAMAGVLSGAGLWRKDMPLISPLGKGQYAMKLSNIHCAITELGVSPAVLDKDLGRAADLRATVIDLCEREASGRLTTKQQKAIDRTFEKVLEKYHDIVRARMQSLGNVKDMTYPKCRAGGASVAEALDDLGLVASPDKELSGFDRIRYKILEQTDGRTEDIHKRKTVIFDGKEITASQFTKAYADALASGRGQFDSNVKEANFCRNIRGRINSYLADPDANAGHAWHGIVKKMENHYRESNPDPEACRTCENFVRVLREIANTTVRSSQYRLYHNSELDAIRSFLQLVEATPENVVGNRAEVKGDITKNIGDLHYFNLSVRQERRHGRSIADRDAEVQQLRL